MCVISTFINTHYYISSLCLGDDLSLYSSSRFTHTKPVRRLNIRRACLSISFCHQWAALCQAKFLCVFHKAQVFVKGLVFTLTHIVFVTITPICDFVISCHYGMTHLTACMNCMWVHIPAYTHFLLWPSKCRKDVMSWVLQWCLGHATPLFISPPLPSGLMSLLWACETQPCVMWNWPSLTKLDKPSPFSSWSCQKDGCSGGNTVVSAMLFLLCMLDKNHHQISWQPFSGQC